MSKIVEHGSQKSYHLQYQAQKIQSLDNRICPMHHTVHPKDKRGMPLHELGSDTIFHLLKNYTPFAPKQTNFLTTSCLVKPPHSKLGFI
jgi:hypothetical protein